ncbi:serine/threonine-protein kinase [Myxococcus xanthus]|uniref:Serine/threonine protein kinase n=1 Tax=Myxococcus xanthus TaxID=34 RepID=A0A7Y4MTG3_MYXXA|nr:serine/threonine-protein kinase [Myxococcus xanthus]NOJ81599.1 serine/threonine protein kinase [Myxococcus xanthus]NOJ89045.1 serine/threonine protein kinase [Myxococcus xanthus]
MRDDGPPAVLSPGDVVVGYTVEWQLGRGGFGTVYRATCEGQAAALKLLHLPRARGRVEREVSILLRLRHPNVVGIRAFGYWPSAAPDFAVIAMEYVEGRQLDVWAKEENPSARQVLKVVLDVARALAATHEAGVVHRDVKEANVMVRASDGLAVLVDYGVGDYEGAPGVTLSVLPPGTPEYRPPEAWLFLEEHSGVRGARYIPGPADDLWALGVVLYHLLTARVPFEAEDDQAFINAVISDTPVPPREMNERVPQSLSDVCLRLLEKDATSRFQNAGALCAALDAALAGAEEAWDVPLCDTYGPDTATTEGDLGEVARWMKDPLHRPRRGKRPESIISVAVSGDVAEVGIDVLPLPRDEGPGEVASEFQEVAQWDDLRGRPQPQDLAHWRWMRVGAGLLGVVVVAVLLWGKREAAPSGGQFEPLRQEVAAYTKKPQAGHAAAPAGQEATPAAAASPAALPEVSATVANVTMKKTESVPSASQSPRKGAGSIRKVVTAAAVCTALACSGPQLRSPPEPEVCPDGAAEGMKKLGMSIGDEETATFPLKGPPKVITVKEGSAQVRLLDGRTFLSGRLIVGDRLYGRLTRARTSNGTFPVCLELQDTSGRRGLEIESGGAGSSEVRVWSTVTLRAVREFE